MKGQAHGSARSTVPAWRLQQRCKLRRDRRIAELEQVRAPRNVDADHRGVRARTGGNVLRKVCQDRVQVEALRERRIVLLGRIEVCGRQRQPGCARCGDIDDTINHTTSASRPVRLIAPPVRTSYEHCTHLHSSTTQPPAFPKTQPRRRPFLRLNPASGLSYAPDRS